MFPAIVGNGASSTTYYCDYHWTNAVATPRTLLIGGGSDDGSAAGLFYLYSHLGLVSSSAHVGTSLKIKEREDGNYIIENFKELLQDWFWGD